MSTKSNIVPRGTAVTGEDKTSLDSVLPDCCATNWLPMPSTGIVSAMGNSFNALLAILLELSEYLSLKSLVDLVFITTFIGKFRHMYLESPTRTLGTFTGTDVKHYHENMYELTNALVRMFADTAKTTAEQCANRLPDKQWFVVAIICENGQRLKYSFNLHSTEMKCEVTGGIIHTPVTHVSASGTQFSEVWFGFAGKETVNLPTTARKNNKVNPDKNIQAFAIEGVKVLSDTLNNWTTSDPIIPAGTIARVNGKNITKIGDGVHRWAELEEFTSEPEGSSAATTDEKFGPVFQLRYGYGHRNNCNVIETLRFNTRLNECPLYSE